MNMYLNALENIYNLERKTNRKLTGYNADILPQTISRASYSSQLLYLLEKPQTKLQVRKYRVTCLKMNGSYKCKHMFII